jgi:hypothetical protein
LGARYHKDDKHKEEKTKHVIKLVFPNCCKDEEEFNEDRSEWQNTRHHGAERRHKHL